MLKRMLSAICLVTICVVMLVGCGAKTPSTSNATPSTPALSGVLTVGVDDSYPPMEYQG